jgi:hypothetical protein
MFYMVSGSATLALEEMHALGDALLLALDPA